VAGSVDVFTTNVASIVAVLITCICVIRITLDVEESSVPHIIRLIHPKLEYQKQLVKKMELLEALKVC